MDDNIWAANINIMPNIDGIEIKSCNCEKSKCLKLYCECFAKN